MSEDKKAKRFFDFENPEWWWENFWTLRGAVAAFLLVSLFEKIFDVPARDFLRFTHSLVVGWDRIASAIGEALGTIVFLPALSAETVSGLCFVSAVIFPAMYSLFDAIRRYRKRPIMGAIAALVGVGMYSTIVIAFFNAAPKLDLSEAGPMATMGLVSIFVSCFHVWFLGLARLPGYMRGLIQIVVTLICLELLYYAPVVGDWMNSVSSFFLGDTPAI